MPAQVWVSFLMRSSSSGSALTRISPRTIGACRLSFATLIEAQRLKSIVFELSSASLERKPGKLLTSPPFFFLTNDRTWHATFFCSRRVKDQGWYDGDTKPKCKETPSSKACPLCYPPVVPSEPRHTATNAIQERIISLILRSVLMAMAMEDYNPLLHKIYRSVARPSGRLLLLF